ncbi:Thymidine kinase [uncultured virus]|nr:Thymidine kinase [uncultured virus]
MLPAPSFMEVVLSFITIVLLLKRRKVGTFKLEQRAFLVEREGYDNAGSLHIRVGPMFCGKTTWLVDEITRYADLNTGTAPLLINHVNDNRDKAISSHSSHFKGVSSRIVTIKTGLLSAVDVSAFDVVGIDEGQWYPDLVKTVLMWVQRGKQVYIAGLDGDFRRGNFGDIRNLLSEADSFVKLQAICTTCIKLKQKTGPLIVSDLTPAPFTAKHSEVSAGLVVVGGADKYTATCRRHHYTPTAPPEEPVTAGLEKPMEKAPRTPYDTSFEGTPSEAPTRTL